MKGPNHHHIFSYSRKCPLSSSAQLNQNNQNNDLSHSPQSFMETLISNSCFFEFKPLSFSSTIFQFKKTRSNPLKPLSFVQSPNRKWSLGSKNLVLSSNSMSYGGWDDLARIEDSSRAGNFDQLNSFLVSLGLDDRKDIVLFVLGFASALAISRVRVSSVLVFSGSVLVFAVGFLFGFVRAGDGGGLRKSIGGNGVDKDEIFRVCDEKLKEFVGVFSEIGIKMGNLQEEMKEFIEFNHLEGVELGSFCSTIEDINVELVEAKRIVDSVIGYGSGDAISVDKVGNKKESNLNHRKLNRKKRGLGESSFDFFKYITGMFGANSIGVQPNKVKNLSKQGLTKESISEMVNSRAHERVSANKLEERESLNQIYGEVVSNKNMDSSHKLASNDLDGKPDDADSVDREARTSEHYQGITSIDSLDNDDNISTLGKNSIVNHQNNSISGYPNKNDGAEPHKSQSYSKDLGVGASNREHELRSFTMKPEASFEQQESSKASNGAYVPSPSMVKEEDNGSYRIGFNKREEESEDTPNTSNRKNEPKKEEDYMSSTSMLAEDVVFEKHLTEATDLLKQAREYLKGEVDEAKADVVLYKSARILSRAIAMKPMSLLAVGQLGNTFLLHGELKLRISRDLRTVLARTDSLSKEEVSRIQVKGLDDQVMSRDAIASILIDVCEECEELLVSAGRKYKTALSIDGNDARALYNWGLALYYRAQLLADIGPGAAFDADKVYLAAIDKFDAMMSKSNVYAPDALFRWGMTLQQRSRLRPRKSKEKVKLLYQAKRLFEDVLSMDSDNLQVREALLSCMSDLNYTNF